MCGRYYIEIDEKELQDIVNEAERKLRGYAEQLSLKLQGDVFPTDIVPVQTHDQGVLPMKWGFAGFDSKPIINARSETALQKPVFQRAMLERRCLIPASGYYEWKKDGSKRIKHQFFSSDSKPIFLAGCYRKEKDNPLFSFVILTQQAVGGMATIHERMPVIIPQAYRRAWLHENPQTMDYPLQEIEYRAV